MKIVLIGGRSIPNQGGIEQYMVNLAAQLHAHGHQVVLMCRGKESKETFCSGVKVVQHWCPECVLSILIHNIRASLYLLLSREPCDIVNYQSIFFPVFYEWLPRLIGAKVIHTQHSFAQDNPKHGKLSKVLIGGVYFFSRMVCSPILTVSQHNQNLVRKRLGRDSTIVRCGVNVQEHVVKSDIVEKYGLEEDEYYLSIGRIDPVKNLDVLIQAFLSRRVSSAKKLVICGDDRNEYGRYLHELAGDDARVVFAGPVYGDYKEALLEYAFAFCLVSTSEGFPIALLEAMAHGCPCICSDIPANEEALSRELGIWCTARDVNDLRKQMESLEKNKGNLKVIGMKLRDRVKMHFSWDKVAATYLGVIKKLIKY